MQVVLHTNYGDITLAMHTETAPKTVENFLQYARDGFYENTLFHRVIDNFMVQGGGFEPGMSQKDTRGTIENEAKTAKPNLTGTVAMARTPDPHSASSQFFINVNDNHFLNFQNETPNGFGYCVFAEVVEGMDVVNNIKGVKTSTAGFHADVPVEDVVITSVTVQEDA
ncbi:MULTISPECIES: peptidylprolyl isomerase [Idiomarina]|jgi:peptidyl-prolyl cis-trans isomerase B (cyclophilin B)|uniref:Peptidyl-prolyl cis-trans isomerase n=2 Tax=Idiomarina baltica TaxID=190892 RepID=A0A348WM37_9GAMM|nr:MULTISPECIES: peptidylprolyl isomerase [Idiomarina]MBR36862.1 peptidylprolyl isomerase [Idiomarina sp.]MEC8925556.1 peptidylprolyl isomerase [Pseudomonadota bacterium]HAR55599.1 peptidylprolyl isomerase [Idiomarina baltica]EAQ30819.1 Peptidyl-prolyl cis-trans isomerase (rotamase), cyclophilin family protein [Idiomarina baltica OS145]KXS35908.1 MAG: Peptidyl-prolyl cis-trans isomerase [Idiomarina sp. T82-3]|tara:strand:- start:11650 stop:12153 length:504 start_codon:yes stop_codon:yes gene_type:complete